MVHTAIVHGGRDRIASQHGGAVENAVKIARAATGRQDIIAFDVGDRPPSTLTARGWYTAGCVHAHVHVDTCAGTAWSLRCKQAV